MSALQKLRNTRQRQVILEELKRVSTHPTADDLYTMVRRRLPRVSLGTVYRNLELLADRNLIQTLEWAGAQRRFDANTENHYHVRCVKCGGVEDLPRHPSLAFQGDLGDVTDYEILGHRLELIGICPTCKRVASRE